MAAADSMLCIRLNALSDTTTTTTTTTITTHGVPQQLLIQCSASAPALFLTELQQPQLQQLQLVVILQPLTVHNCST